MRLIYSIRLELLLDPRIKIEQVNSIELKLDPTITLKKTIIYYNLQQVFNKDIIVYYF